MSIPEARCAIHSLPARQPCTRCGVFLCERCEVSTAGWCAPCWERFSPQREVRASVERWAFASVAIPLLGALLVFRGAGWGVLVSAVSVGSLVSAVTLFRAWRHGLGQFYVHAVIGLCVVSLLGLLSFIPPR